MSAEKGRPRSRPLPQAQIEELVAELRRLEESVHSDGSASGKDAKSRRALRLAGVLIESLVGWAVDHQVGLAVDGVLYEPLDLQPADEGDDVDDRRHGQAGAVYDWSNPAVNRRALANLLAANPGGFPEELALECALGLEALLLDETRALFERRTRRLEDTHYALATLRLRAVEHVTFYANTGADRDQAERKVAQAYDIDTDRLRRWEARLPYLLGPVGVGESLDRAALAGMTARRLGLPLCEAEVRKRDQRLRSDSASHNAARRDLHERIGR